MKRMGWLLAGLLVGSGILAWGLDSPGGPTDAASEMYSLEAVYNRLDTGAPGTPGVFAAPSAGPTAGVGRTLNEVMGVAPATNANAAVAGEVLSGQLFWGLDAGAWGEQGGTMPNIGQQNVTPGTASQAITQGYHDGTGSVAGDADLVTGNIRSGVSIFGVSGSSSVVDTSSGDAVAGDVLTGKKAWVNGSEITGTAKPAPVPKTGQTTSYASGDDGDLELGTAWPSPRFTDHGNGTVTDNLTGPPAPGHRPLRMWQS